MGGSPSSPPGNSGNICSASDTSDILIDIVGEYSSSKLVGLEDLAKEGVLAVYTSAPIRRPQLWVDAKVWHPHKVSMRLPVTVLLDTGAGGGNYVSFAFWLSVQKWGGLAI